MEFLHFDPVNVLVVAVFAVGSWYTLRSETQWHSMWIKKHDDECDSQRKLNSELLAELRTSNVHLATLVEGHTGRLDKVDGEIIRLRDHKS